MKTLKFLSMNLEVPCSRPCFANPDDDGDAGGGRPDSYDNELAVTDDVRCVMAATLTFLFPALVAMMGVVAAAVGSCLNEHNLVCCNAALATEQRMLITVLFAWSQLNIRRLEQKELLSHIKTGSRRIPRNELPPRLILHCARCGSTPNNMFH